MSTYYYQDDHEGSVTQLTDASGACDRELSLRCVWCGHDQRWQAVRSLRRAQYNNRFLFTGREYIQQFGIYEYRARTYHPGLGRFLSEDPKGFDAGDYNLFRYCKNDPEDLTDPMGLDPGTGARILETRLPGGFAGLWGGFGGNWGPLLMAEAPPSNGTEPKEDNSRGYIGEGYSRRNWKERDQEIGFTMDKDGAAVMERATVSTVRQPTYEGPRLAVGNAIDARWLTHFGPTAAEGLSQYRFATAAAKTGGWYGAGGVGVIAGSEILTGSGIARATQATAHQFTARAAFWRALFESIAGKQGPKPPPPVPQPPGTVAEGPAVPGPGL